jgi:hypothetical protein
LSPLKSIFDSKGASTSTLNNNNESIRQVQEATLVNLGTKEDPKWVYIGKQCSVNEITKFNELFLKFKDVFVWSYEDLKVFDME